MARFKSLSRRKWLKGSLGALAAGAAAPWLLPGRAFAHMEIAQWDEEPDESKKGPEMGKAPAGIESDFSLTRITPIDVPGVHSYFDLFPESPDGKRVVYYAFDDGLKAPGRVVVTDRDGHEHRTIRKDLRGNVHAGVFQQWVNNSTLSIALGGETLIIDVDSGDTRTVPGRVRMVSPDGTTGLTHTPRGETPSRVYLVDLETGESRPAFDTLEVLENHPQKGGNFDPAKLYFKHTKWSYAGDRFMAVFSNGTYPKPEDEEQVFSILVADKDGSNVRRVADALGHMFWDPSGESLWGVEFPENLWLPEWYLVERPLDGGEGRRIHMELFGNHALLTPDGKHFAVDVLHGPPETGTGVFLVDADTKEWKWIARFPLPGMVAHPHPVWSRDGRRVYFNILEDGMPALFAADVFPA